MADIQYRDDAPLLLSFFHAGWENVERDRIRLFHTIVRFINCRSPAQWKPGLTLLSRSAKRLDTVLQTHSLFLRRSNLQPSFFFDTRGDGHVQIFARNPYPRWNPPSCQKILTGRLYYSGITVARLVGRVFRVKAFFCHWSGLLDVVIRIMHKFGLYCWWSILVGFVWLV